ncbi:hypothetical protein VTN96DRAFT_2433 [Rasamsonia emersonii]
MHLLSSPSSSSSSFGSLLFFPSSSIAPRGAGRIWRSLATTITPPTKQYKHPNPGNFINRPKDEMREIARKGGQKGGKARGVGGFHNMDPGKQRAIASKGGRASGASFQKGSERARQAGRKGGIARSQNPFREE